MSTISEQIGAVTEVIAINTMWILFVRYAFICLPPQLNVVLQHQQNRPEQ